MELQQPPLLVGACDGELGRRSNQERQCARLHSHPRARHRPQLCLSGHSRIQSLRRAHHVSLLTTIGKQAERGYRVWRNHKSADRHCCAVGAREGAWRHPRHPFLVSTYVMEKRSTCRDAFSVSTGLQTPLWLTVDRMTGWMKEGVVRGLDTGESNAFARSSLLRSTECDVAPCWSPLDTVRS